MLFPERVVVYFDLCEPGAAWHYAAAKDGDFPVHTVDYGDALFASVFGENSDRQPAPLPCELSDDEQVWLANLVLERAEEAGELTFGFARYRSVMDPAEIAAFAIQSAQYAES